MGGSVDGAREKEAKGQVRRAKLYEYLDHTADIQIHAWGKSLPEAFEQAALGMFGYMTDMELVDIDATQTQEVRCSGHDLQSLLFAFMDELLFFFSTEGVIVADVRVETFEARDESFAINARVFGEKFDIMNKHTQGTEVKAITYSAMQIHTKFKGDVLYPCHIFIVVDI